MQDKLSNQPWIVIAAWLIYSSLRPFAGPDGYNDMLLNYNVPRGLYINYINRTWSEPLKLSLANLQRIVVNLPIMIALLQAVVKVGFERWRNS